METDDFNAVTAKNVRGLHCISRENAGEAPFYYLYNAHGDVTKLVDELGNVLTDYSYDPFGNQKQQLLNAAAGNLQFSQWQEETQQIHNPFRYCGEYLDSETGNYYLRARYYDPAVQRFISEDNAKDGLNWYVYCGNNPVMFIDPSGYWKESDSKYSTTVQAELLKLTLAWHLATEDADKKDINERAEEIRRKASKGLVGFLDKAKSASGAAADEFSWFLGGDVSRVERDYWLSQVQQYESKIFVTEKTKLNASIFIIGILAPSPDDAVKMISPKALKQMNKAIGEKEVKKFLKSMTKYARRQGDNGIKPLRGNGVKGYMWEVKVKGKGGAYRLLGNKNADGEIYWDAFEKTH